jgi:N-acetylmuramoyl-L-alanine amidase
LFLNLTGKLSILKRYFICIYFIFLAPVLFTLSASAEGKVAVRDIKHYSSPDYTRIVIDLSGPVEFSKNRLSNPDRLYFDLKNAVITKEIKTSLPVGDGILKTVRASQFSGDTVRVVCDIEEISDFKSFMLDDPSRLVIDLYGKGTKAEKQNTKTVKRRIVIDAGHGGHDPGAVGPKKLYEKNVVLDIALKLKKILKSDPSNEVFLTREGDVFIPLEERTAIANKKNADLFVSIHANASPRKQAKGIETYLLNWTDDEEAMRVAARENAISIKKMKALNRQMDIVSVITNDLMRQNKRDESLKLANYIQKSMVSGLESNYTDLTDLGVKQALFYVLFGAKMPSVLVEVSFISNPEEEALLSSETYRVHIAKAIADGLHTYISSSLPAQKIVGLRDDRIQIR